MQGRKPNAQAQSGRHIWTEVHLKGKAGSGKLRSSGWAEVEFGSRECVQWSRSIPQEKRKKGGREEKEEDRREREREREGKLIQASRCSIRGVGEALTDASQGRT